MERETTARRDSKAKEQTHHRTTERRNKYRKKNNFEMNTTQGGATAITINGISNLIGALP